MALIVPIHGQMSGSIGDNVYSHNKGGPYVRRRSIPINPSTDRQSAVRGNLSTAARAWQALTQIQREAWSAYAVANPVLNRLGQSITLSGAAYHNRLNAKIRDFGGTAILVPPSTAGPVALATLTMSSNTATGVVLAYTATPLSASQRLEVWMTPPAPSGVSPNFNQARLVATTAAAQASPVAVATPWSLVAGMTSNIYCRVVDASGRTSPARRFRATFS